MNRIDLHIHTQASDGKLDVNEIISLANKKGVNYISITDHDSIDAVNDAIILGKKHNINVIPGIEITTNWKAMVHILGYFIDVNNKSLKEVCTKLQNHRIIELISVIKNLKKIGIDIDVFDIKLQKIDGIKPLAKYMYKKGYGNSEEEILNKYLRRGGEVYVPRQGLDYKEAIETIKNSGGIAVLAHPGRIKVSRDELIVFINELVDSGLDGIEVYSDHNKDIDFFKNICEEKNLLITGGSDFHNLEENEIGKYRGKEIPFDTVFNNLQSLL